MAAVQPYFTPEFVGRHPDTPWWDPHNFVVHIAVVAGVPGVLLLGLLVLVQRPRASGWAFASLAIGVTLLFQALAIPTVSLLMLMMGVASSPPRPVGVVEPPVWKHLVGPLAGLGIVLGGWLAVTDLVFYDAVKKGDATAMEHAARLAPGDPLLWSFVQGQYVSESAWSVEAIDQAIHAGEVLTDSESDRVKWWVLRANHYVSMGEYDRAAEMLAVASELQPWSAQVSVVRYRLANLSGDGQLLAQAESELCRMGFETCAASEGRGG